MVSTARIITIAKEYKKYVEKKKTTPKTITIKDKTYTYQECTYLFSKFIINQKNDITRFSIKKPANIRGQDISENVLKADYTDMAKRTIEYIERKKQAPDFITTQKSKKHVRVTLYNYAFAKIVVYYGLKKQLPNYVTISSSDFSKSTQTTTKKYGHATKQGCDNMGQNTGYYCGCHSLQEVFRNLTGKIVPQSTIARWAGTTTAGTGHSGLETAVAMFNKTYGYNLKVQWKNISDFGWSGVKKALASSNQDIVFHNLYRDQWGHYEVVNSISGEINVQNSLGTQGCGSCYCGYVEERSAGTFERYMSGISQPSLMIITRG